MEAILTDTGISAERIDKAEEFCFSHIELCYHLLASVNLEFSSLAEQIEIVHVITAPIGSFLGK